MGERNLVNDFFYYSKILELASKLMTNPNYYLTIKSIIL